MESLAYSGERKLRMLVNLLIVYIYIFVAVILSYFITNEHLQSVLFYCAVVLTSVMFASLAEHTKSKVFYRFFMFASFFILFFILGFRNFTAIDDPSYISIFEQISYIGWFEYFKASTMEPGYLLLNSLVLLFTDNYLYMQLITSFIPLALFYYGFTKYKHIISLPTAVFILCSMLYFQMLSAGLIRMFIAIGIVFVALRYIPKFKPFKYILLIMLAGTFHYSSLSMLVLVLFAIDRKTLTKRVSRFYTLTFFLSPFIFIIVGRFIAPMLGARYQVYGDISSINIGLSTFTTLPIILLLLFFYKKFKGEEQLYFKLFLFIYSLSIVISIFGGLASLGRLIFYTYASLILGVAMVNKKIRFNSNKLIFTSIIILYGFVYLFYTQFTNDHHIPNLFPYESYFSV